MKRNNLPPIVAECAKLLGISEEQAAKKIDELYRKEGVPPLAPPMNPDESEKARQSLLEKPVRQKNRFPFPLPDIYYYTTDGTPDGVYDHDDPEYLEKLSGDAYGAINEYLILYYKNATHFLNKEQLKIATDVALDIRMEHPELREIPLAKNPDYPVEQDFIRLGQWFLDAHTAITKDSEKADTAGDKKTKRGRQKKYTPEIPEAMHNLYEDEYEKNRDAKGSWYKVAKTFGIKTKDGSEYSGKAAEMAWRRGRKKQNK